MKTVTNAFNEKMNDTLRSYIPRLTINGSIVTGSIMPGLTINYGSCGEESFAPGAIFIPSITVSIINCTDNIQGKEMLLEMGLKLDNGTVEYVPMGYFTAEKPTKDKYTISFTAYGRLMSKLGRYYVTELTYPTTINQVINEIKTKTGVDIVFNNLSGTGQITSPIAAMPYRDALGIVAGCLGGFVTERADGKIIISKFALNDAAAIDTSFCYSYPVVYDDDYEIKGVTVVSGENVYSSATDEHNVEFNNDYVTQSLFNTIVSNIVGIKFTPAEVQFLGDIRIDPWDSALLTDGPGDAGIKVPCMSITHTWDGGIVTRVAATGTTATEDQAAFVGPVEKALDEMGETVDFIKLRVKQLDVDSLVAVKAYIDTLIASNITAEKIIADSGKLNNANITNLIANVIDAAIIDVRNLNATKITTGELDASKVNVKNINGNEILDGTIIAKALTHEAVETISGIKVYYDATEPTVTMIDGQYTDADGHVMRNGDTWYKTLITDTDADKSVLHIWNESQWAASDFDARLLRANTITAQEIASATITAGEIDMQSLQTSIAQVGDNSIAENEDTASYISLDSDSIDVHRVTKSGETINDDVVATFGETAVFRQGDTSLAINNSGIELFNDAEKIYSVKKVSSDKQVSMTEIRTTVGSATDTVTFDIAPNRVSLIYMLDYVTGVKKNTVITDYTLNGNTLTINVPDNVSYYNAKFYVGVNSRTYEIGSKYIKYEMGVSLTADYIKRMQSITHVVSSGGGNPIACTPSISGKVLTLTFATANEANIAYQQSTASGVYVRVSVNDNPRNYRRDYTIYYYANAQTSQVMKGVTETDRLVTGSIYYEGMSTPILGVGSVITLGTECYTQGTGVSTTISTTTSYNTLKNPNEFGYPGTWALIDKDMARGVWTGALTIRNTTNVSSISVQYLLRNGKTFHTRCSFVNKNAHSDTTRELLNFPTTSVGISSIGYTNINFTGIDDGGNGIVELNLTTAGVLSEIDFISRATSIPTTTACTTSFTLTFMVDMSVIYDSVCDKFYWKRIA